MAPSSSLARPIATITLILVVGALACWLLRGRSEPPRPREAAARCDAPADELALREGPPTGPRLQGAPDAVMPPVAADALTAAAKRWTLTFESLDADGTPRHWRSAALLDRAGKHLQWIAPAYGEVATEGTLEVAGSGRLVVRSRERLPWTSEWLAPPPSGERHLIIRFDPGLAVAGMVYEQDGITRLMKGNVKVISPANVVGRWQSIDWNASKIQENGLFRIGGLPPGPVRLEVQAFDFVKGRPTAFDVEAGEEHLRLVLDAEGAIAFLIVDETTGLAPCTAYLRLTEVEADGERAWFTTAIGKPREAKPSAWFRADPGKTYRFLVEARSYEPSEVFTVSVPETGGKQVIPISLRPAPGSGATLTIHLGVPGGDLPEQIPVSLHADRDQDAGEYQRVEGERIVLELMPGPHHIEVGRAWRPDPAAESTFLVPVDMKLTLEPGEQRAVEVTLEMGGWAVLQGEPDVLPDRVRLIQGEQVVTCQAIPSGGSKGRRYVLGVLPPGRWTLEVASTLDGRPVGRRATFQIARGKVTRIDAKELEAFEVEGE